MRRDCSPFRGADGWEETCGVYASVYHDADTYVSHPPVRGGVLDAPRSRDCRGGVVAAVRLGRLYPRLIRCAHFRPPPHVFDPAGTARAPFLRARRRRPLTDAGRAWKPAPTVGIRISPTLHQPLSHGAERRDSSPFRGAEGWVETCGVYAFVYHDADTVVFLPPPTVGACG